MRDKKSVGYYIGYACGTIILICLAACLSGVAIALTFKFLSWIF